MNNATSLDLTKYIRDIPDFPKEGIIFKDITPLLQNKDAFRQAVDQMCDKYKDTHIDVVVGVEARGFIFGAAVAYKLGRGFIPIRKPGKLPFDTVSKTYALEYGQDTVEVHKDAFESGKKVLVVDDLLATGGTVGAVCELIEQVGGDIIGISFLIELTFLNGIEKIKKYPIDVLIKY